MGEYTLVITEKPDAAKRIAEALDKRGTPKRLQERSLPYYLVDRDRQLVVVPALGHLYTVAGSEKGTRSRYPVFGYRWVPRYVADRKAARTRTWLEAIARLAEDADEFIDACDYDIEGSIIGYNILKHACGDKEKTAKRMKYSTLTREELEQAYENPQPSLDFALIEAGLTRHEVDWLYGINLSRALTTAAKNHSGKYTTLSTGRVQGPTLRFIAEREKEIKAFVPIPYWEVKAQTEIDGKTFEAHHEKGRIETRREAETIVKDCRGKDGTAERVETKAFKQPPPIPFDLGALQSEAYRLFGYTPKRTSDIAQRLYLDALISYPRTSSQKLPPSIDYRAILKNLGKSSQYQQLIAELLAKPKLRPNEGKASDPAHPAIYPTGMLPARALGNAERKMHDLVVRRFMAVFADLASGQSTIVSINVNGHHFLLFGRRLLKEGWMRFYEPFVRFEEVLLPLVHEEQRVKTKRVLLEEKFTNQPFRYTAGSLLRQMEKAGIGTKATRADIIQTLYAREYVEGQKMTVTDLGLEVLNVLEKHCPTVVSTEFTRKLEEEMESIQTYGQERETVLAETTNALKPALGKLKENEKTIGAQLTEAINKAKAEEKTVGQCPTCNTGKLTIVHSRKTGKRFIGCTNYFKGLCKTSSPLPQKGNLKPTHRTCLTCRWPTIWVLNRGRRPWNLCPNPQCPTKKKRRRETVEMQTVH